VATTPAKRACPVCGALLADDSAFCPVCAFQQALGTQTYSVSNSSSELRFEHYTVLKEAQGKPLELGRGGMGVTYKAFDVHLQCPVALKIIKAQLFGNESARLRFIREARAAASVRHSNVASVFHIGESCGNYYYAMEFVDGENLAALIRRSGRLETDLALGIAERVAAGLVAIEKQHLVHRDIKPSNIMVSLQDGKLESVKIIDLGLAKGVAEENTLSTVGVFIGTPAYASPEQFAGIATDIRSDLYSLGITLWEMLSANLPFAGSAAELMYQHQHVDPPIEKLKSVAAPVVTLLQLLLSKNPGGRFQSPAQLQKALTKVRGAIGSDAGLTADELLSVNVEVTPGATKWSPRKQTIPWVVGAGLCFASVVIAYFFFSPYRGALSDQRSGEAVPTEKSIAVLPFENISQSKDDDYFADGVQDEILNNLAKIAQLKVISRTSVMKYRAGTDRDLRQIANALDVANVLEGTVRRDGNHVRVSTELVDARSDHTIWADSYDRDLTDIFAIQSQIAQSIAGRLTATLSPEEKRRIEAKPTDNLEAYDAYLQAKELTAYARVFPLLTGYEKGLHEAINLLDRAVRLDPSFTLAYCESAGAHDELYRAYDPTPERRALADAAIASALRLQPDLPEAHLRYADHLYTAYRDYERARIQLAIARRGLPNDPEVMALGAYMNRRQGNFEKAIQELREIITVDPRNPMTELANSLQIMRRFSEAENAYNRAIDLAPDHPILKVIKAHDVIFMKTGDDTAFRSALADLPISMAGDRDTLTWRLISTLIVRDWKKATEIVEKMKGGDDDGGFAYMQVPVPASCYLVLIARVEGEPLGDNSGFAETREQFDQRVQELQGDGRARMLSQLAVFDALFGKEQDAIAEGKRASEMLPISEDAVDGPLILQNLAVVYAWADQPNLAFEVLDSLTRTPNGVYYGELREPYWDPIRKDPRFDKLSAELAPRD
jgi:serine/threonine protein kinase